MKTNRLVDVINDIESYGDDFDDIMAEYMINGIIYITPEDFVIARYSAEDQDFFVYYCRGSIKNLLKKIDFPIKTISFVREGWLRQYDYSKFHKKA